MRKKLADKRVRAVLTGLLLALAAAPLLLYVVLSLGWPPVLGNLAAAREMRAYAAKVHPDWGTESRWAVYNLVDDGYFLSFTDGAQTHSLDYGADGKVIRDEEREAALREGLGVDRAIRVNGLWIPDQYTTYWSARWSSREPERPRIAVDVLCYDSADAPIPEESALRERMAEQGMKAYDALAPVTPVHAFSIRYCHRGVHGQDGELAWSIIRVDIPDGAVLTREEILSGKLTVK